MNEIFGVNRGAKKEKYKYKRGGGGGYPKIVGLTHTKRSFTFMVQLLYGEGQH